MKPQYCAIIGDINKSRQLQKRGAVQIIFERAVEQINKTFKDEIASNFLITTGDEFQGLLFTPAISYQLVRYFQDAMNKVNFSFGIGVGTLATNLLPKSAIGMDGDCFYRARAALQKAKKEKRELFYDFDNPASELVNALVTLLDKQWNQLNDTQKKIVLLRKNKMTQQAIAKKLRITKQAVSKAIRATTIEEMGQSVLALNSFLKQYANIVKSTT
jgi:biotin operon repressor